MPYAAALSLSPDGHQGLQEVSTEVRTSLGSEAPDLSLLIVSRSHLELFPELVETACRTTGSRHLLACTADGVIGDDREIESGPAISLWSARLPGAEIESFHVEFERTPDGPICIGMPDGPADVAQVADTRAVLMLADPFSFPIDTVISRLADELPGVPLIGGMASGGTAPGENSLGWNGEEFHQGGVGVIIRGGPAIRSIVSQGCRPIGSTFVVTRTEQNVVFELGGKPALSRLEETYAGLSDRDRQLIRQGLHLGAIIDEYKPSLARGNFLIANVLGADRESGAIAVGTIVRPGQTVQFHVRDASSADEDLRGMLTERMEGQEERPRGALLFSCNGRGTRLFPSPNHDAGVLRSVCGSIPLSGFFAQGELGPVGGRNYIHGFTASIALFEDL